LKDSRPSKSEKKVDQIVGKRKDERKDTRREQRKDKG